ncbi:IMPACT family protein [Rehaibacterium terrae]|jgi:uncharacterized YigZ family protein|uniref:Putative YigZ family protein n=1 Tax=Rehaibacterium terrae TaxID=1341696 RepID=A0A7W8DDF7_9GAMM|nr:YigZ family protein [Rehaibacterium terrae]MBB5014899.1 putative YigZ family protein [Rehaibacterium terrae]
MSRRQTLAGPASFELEVKKSRHLAQAAPVDSPEAALAFLDRVADPAATHNCWAYRIGQHYRFSDDGEPAGTAGRPILAAIDGQGLDGVMVVVTRWFGGIKLGAGGLARAYGGAAAECLRLAPRITLVDTCEADIAAGFEHAGTLHTLLAQHQAEKLDEHYAADGLRLRIRLPADRLDALAAALRDATRGQARLETTE